MLENVEQFITFVPLPSNSLGLTVLYNSLDTNCCPSIQTNIINFSYFLKILFSVLLTQLS